MPWWNSYLEMWKVFYAVPSYTFWSVLHWNQLQIITLSFHSLNFIKERNVLESTDYPKDVLWGAHLPGDKTLPGQLQHQSLWAQCSRPEVPVRMVTTARRAGAGWVLGPPALRVKEAALQPLASPRAIWNLSVCRRPECSTFHFSSSWDGGCGPQVPNCGT